MTLGRIDTHQHLVPAGYAAWLRERGIRPGGVDVPEWSAKRAIRLMDRTHISTGILSLSTPGVHFGDDAEARRWARTVNEESAGLVHEHPGRFGFFATLTLPDVDGAVREAEYALDTLGADGIVLLANTDGRYLGDAAFAPLLAMLDERAAVVFIHPGELPAEPVPGVPAFAADFLLDTTRTVLDLVLSGALARYNRIKFILAHAGGFVPYISNRILLAMLRDAGTLKRAVTLLDPDRNVPRELAVLRRFHYDLALSTAPATVNALLDVAGPERITFGSDYPFAPPPAVRLMTRAYEAQPLSSEARRRIDRGNAEALFPRLQEVAHPTPAIRGHHRGNRPAAAPP